MTTRSSCLAASLFVAIAVLPPAAGAQGWTLELASLGQAGTAEIGASAPVYVSADGTRVAFESREALVAADVDSAQDVFVYDRTAGTTALLSGGVADVDAFLVSPIRPGGVSPGLDRVYFETGEPLAAPDDSGTSIDVYEASASGIRLVSGGSASFGAAFSAASNDGSRIFFSTEAALSGADSGTKGDVYQRTASGLGLISAGDATDPSFFLATSTDGVRVFFLTEASRAAADTDGELDAYIREGPAVTLATPDVGQVTSFGPASPDGLRLFFSTPEKLVPASDNNALVDIYERSADSYKLVSSGLPAATVISSAALAANGARAFFVSDDPLVPADTDSTEDVYQRISGGDLTLASGGTAEAPAFFAGSSEDGTRAWFHTTESLSGADGDGASDVYERFGGGVTLISAGSASLDAFRVGASSDGTRVLFRTAERLAPGDADDSEDLYMRSGSGPPELVSCGSASLAPDFEANNPSASAVAFLTDEPILAADADLSQDVYLARTPGICPGADPGNGGGGGTGGGGSATPPAGTSGNGVIPAILTATVRPTRFVVNRRGVAELPVSGARRGTRFRYALSEAARVVFTIERRSTGRRLRGRCVRQTPRNRNRPTCTRYRRVGAFAHSGAAGSNVKSFSGKVGSRALRRGRYRARLVASDADGASRPRRLAFRIVRR